MSDITKISVLENGEQVTVDLTSNNVVTDSITVGGVGGTVLDKATLDTLIAGSSGGSYAVEKFLLDNTDESNKFITLAVPPPIPGNTILLVDGAPNLTYGLDYQVVGDQLQWFDLGLDGLLVTGDNLTVTYNT